MASGRNNARRRRVILDDIVQQTDGGAPVGKTPERPSKVIDLKNSYSDAAKHRGQLKTTDLIPKRPLPIAILVSVILLVVVAINSLAYFATNGLVLERDAVRTLGFSGVGTISAWFSSMLLMITGMASLQIYGMRKHRCDDYRGHYRIWLFLAVLFLVASANCVIDFKSVMRSLSQSWGFGGRDSLVLLLLAKLVALTALVVRGILEIRASKAAFTAVVCVWIAYASAIVLQIPAVEKELVDNGGVVLGNMILVGNVCLFLSVLFYARFVYLHANSLIKLETESTLEKGEKVNSKSAVNKTDSVISKTGIVATEFESEPSDSDEEEILKLSNLENSPLGARLKKGKKRNKKSQKSQRRAA